MTKFDNHDNRPTNNSLTATERARLVELHFERGAERQLLSDVNLARTLHLGVVLNELEIAPC
jgi:hypothetical protein